MPQQTSSSIIIAESPAMKKVLEMALRIAREDVHVLIWGETGVGKDVTVEHIHGNSLRKDKELMTLNLSEQPETMLETILFGHEKASFTGAEAQTTGYFQQADKGTLHLAEVDDMVFHIQGKIQQFLETGRVTRVGGTLVIKTDVRVIATTKKNLRDLVEAGLFRPDLFYRLNIYPIYIPPLRERPEDILPLIRHFLGKYPGGNDIVLETDAIQALVDLPWYGNCRELESAIRRLTYLDKTIIRKVDIPLDILSADRREMPTESKPLPMNNEAEKTIDEKLMSYEKALIADALKESKGNLTLAAKILGMKIPALHARMKKLGLDRAEYK